MQIIAWDPSVMTASADTRVRGSHGPCLALRQGSSITWLTQNLTGGFWLGIGTTGQGPPGLALAITSGGEQG